MHSSGRYLAKLTWLRGLAATLVVVSHSIRLSEGQYYEETHEVSKSLFWYFDLGTFGVMLFFALSGATLYFSNKNIKGLNGHVRFYIKRVMRIWPTFALAMIVYVLFMPVFREFYIVPEGNWVEAQFLASWDWLDFTSYITLSSNIWGQPGLFNNAFWSLPVEFQYYLIFPLILLSIRYTSLIGPIVIAALLYVIQKFSWIDLIDQRIFLLAYTFCFGMLLAYLYEKTRFRLNKVAAIFLFILSMTLCSLAENGIIGFGNIPFISNMYGWNGLFGLLCVASLLFCDRDMDQNAWLIKPFYFLGEISFSLYLYHNLVIAILLLILLALNGHMILHSPFLIFCIVLPITLPLASLSYRYVEKTSIMFGKHLTNKVQNANAEDLQAERISDNKNKLSNSKQ